MINLKTVTAVVALILPMGASAATYNVNITFDGTNTSLDAGSDTPAGTVLADGD